MGKAAKAPAPTTRRNQRARPGAAEPATTPAATNGPVVGVGASAGGLEAVSALLEAVPVDSGLAIVIIQHLDPTNKSLLVELLARRTAIPVRQTADGMTVQANCVYVIPPGAYLAIVNGQFQLSESPTRTLRLPVDFFLHSLAQDRGKQAIGVVLSGTGADGTLGLKAIKEAGGLTLVQDPAEATFDGMPRSAIDAGAADYILSVREMPAAMLRFAARDYARNGETQVAEDNVEDAEARAALVVNALHTAVGEDFALYRTGTLLRRVERRMALTATDDFPGYVARLRSDTAEADALAKDLLINVTSFFRDNAAFTFLAEHVLPPLVARQGTDQPIRVWVAGCATGEEAYSLAILLLEQVASAGKRTRVQIFATDIDADALAIARAGVYPESIEANVSAERLRRFFTKAGHQYTVGEGLRKTIVFARHNLLSDPPLSRFDLISCRNLLIYLRPEAQKRVIALFHFALRDHGVLFLGASESVGEATNLFEPIERAYRIFRLIRPVHRPWASLPTLGRADAPTPLAGLRPGAAPARRRLADLAQRALLDQYAPASVIIDRNRNALYFFGAIDRFMALATGEPGQDVLLMARQGLRPRLRDAVERGFRTGKRVTARGVRIQRASRLAHVTIEVSPVAEADGALLLVSFIQEASLPARVTAGAEHEATPELQAELDATRKELTRTIRDLERTNEELTGVSEEAISMNEELQATNEELETSKEELQSLNEELTTLNTELRQSLDAQNAAANDLTNLLNGIGIATLFLDAGLRIKFFNPPANVLFSIITADIGRPLSDLAQKFADPDLLADTEMVLATGTQTQREIRGERGTWYNRTILPYRTESGAGEGVVITFADITAAKVAELAADRARAFAETIVETIHEPLVVLDHGLRVISANPAFMTVFAVAADAVKGRALHELGSPALRDRKLGEIVDRLARQTDLIVDQEITIEGSGEPPRTLMLSGRGLPDNPPGAEMILLVVEDVTERRSSIEQQFQSFMDAMPEPIFTTSEGGRVRSVNTGMERLFGYDASELIGQPVEILVPADRRIGHQSLHRAYLNDPRPRPMGGGLEIHGVTKDGRIVPLEIALTPIRGSAGLTVTAVVRDISERRRVEQVLTDARMEAQRANRAKSRFLQAASHDLRQPLQVVRLLHGALAARTTDAAGKAMLERLETTVDVMSGVLGAFLDVSQIESGTITPSIVEFPAAGLLARLRDAFGALAAAKGLVLRIVPSSATIRSDPRLLERILGNLLSNAVQYTETGRILLGCRRHRETLTIEVWDTGRGIPDEHIAEIFDEFYQVGPSSSPSAANVGIGLYIVDQLARLLGHKVTVRSSPGKGTVFSITVPLGGHGAEGDASSAADPFAAGNPDLPQVLVIEDDEAQRASMRLLLSAHGHAVETARSGQEAIALAAGPRGFRPDVILADYNLGGDMNGPEAVRQIAARLNRSVPAVIITGDVSQQAARAVAGAGLPLLHKPVRPAMLLQTIQNLAPPASGRSFPAPRPEPPAEPPPAGLATVAIIDDDQGVRDAMRDMLVANGYEVVSHPSAEAFLADPNRRGYKCLLVDIGLPGMDGLELQRRLAAEEPSPPMIFITGGADLPLAVRAMRDGAADFLEKPVRAAALLESVAQASASRPMNGRGTDSETAAGRDAETRIGELTRRQRDVLERMIDGQPNKNIAADLNLSQRTIEHHRSAVMTKLGVKSLAELIRMVMHGRH
jgi:two-component system CheB/CheR fusion protein